MIDSRELSELHPALKRAALELQHRCKERGIDIIFTSTYRDNEYQDMLFKKGGVTKARGGQSMHNYRLAFDFAPITASGSINWSDSEPNWNKVGTIGMEMGLEWGGSWKNFVDKPHFQFTNGHSLAQLQAGSKVEENAVLKWEKTIKTEVSDVFQQKRYETKEELPQWAKPTIEKLIEKGCMTGTGKGLGLSEDMTRILVINDRAGVYDLK